jgi:hypothetical protein
MTSSSNAGMEAAPSDLVEDKITSDSNSSVEGQEKTQEVQPVGEGQVENEKSQKSESVTALLQVVGAFFLMFNSWYVLSIVRVLKGVLIEIGELRILLEPIKSSMKRIY